MITMNFKHAAVDETIYINGNSYGMSAIETSFHEI